MAGPAGAARPRSTSNSRRYTAAASPWPDARRGRPGRAQSGCGSAARTTPVAGGRSSPPGPNACDAVENRGPRPSDAPAGRTATTPPSTAIRSHDPESVAISRKAAAIRRPSGSYSRTHPIAWSRITANPPARAAIESDPVWISPSDPDRPSNGGAAAANSPSRPSMNTRSPGQNQARWWARSGWVARVRTDAGRVPSARHWRTTRAARSSDGSGMTAQARPRPRAVNPWSQPGQVRAMSSRQTRAANTRPGRRRKPAGTASVRLRAVTGPATTAKNGTRRACQQARRANPSQAQPRQPAAARRLARNETSPSPSNTQNAQAARLYPPPAPSGPSRHGDANRPANRGSSGSGPAHTAGDSSAGSVRPRAWCGDTRQAPRLAGSNHRGGRGASAVGDTHRPTQHSPTSSGPSTYQSSRLTQAAMTTGSARWARPPRRNSHRHRASSNSEAHAGWSESRGDMASTASRITPAASQNGPVRRAAPSMSPTVRATRAALSATSPPPPTATCAWYRTKSASQS